MHCPKIFLWYTYIWYEILTLLRSEEEVGPALMTMRKQSSADRKGRAGASGTDLFDGETM